MKVFILAGGFATRLWPLTEHRAKPLLPIAGKPIISHLVEKIPTELSITVSTNAAFSKGFQSWREVMVSSSNHDITLIVEGTKRDDQKLGALGSIAQWIEDEGIDDDVLILTGDNYLGFSLDRFLEAFDGNPLLAAHDIGDLERAKAFGTVILDRAHEGAHLVDGHESSPSRLRVAGFEEKPKDPKSTLVSTGCVILPKSSLPVVKEFAKVKPDNLGGIFEELVRRGVTVECFTFGERWVDIGSFQSYLDAHKLLVGERTMTDASAQVSESQMTGSVSVGKHCVVERSQLTDCMVFDNVTIRDCTLRNCVIDEHCVLEGIDLQKQMLRSGTRLIVR